MIEFEIFSLIHLISIISIISIILYIFYIKNNKWKIECNNDNFSVFITKFNNLSDYILEINNTLIKFDSMNEKLNEISDKVNILEDEISNKIRKKLFLIAKNSTQGFNPRLEPERVFLSWVYGKTIDKLSDNFKKLINNISLATDKNFKILLLGQSKSDLMSSFIGTDINGNACFLPIRFINDAVNIQEESYQSFISNLELSISIVKKDEISIKEIALEILYSEFEIYVNKLSIAFERSSKDIRDVNYLKERYPESIHLKHDSKSSQNFEFKKEDITKTILIDWIRKDNNGLKQVFEILKRITDMDTELSKIIINLNGQFSELYNSNLKGLDVPISEFNKIRNNLIDIIENNFEK